MADFLGAVVDAVILIIKFIMNLLLDIFCLFLFILSLPAFWRIASWGDVWDDCSDSSGRWQFRAFCGVCLLKSMFDILTLLPFAFSLCSWRVFYFFSGLWSIDWSNKRESYLRSRFFCWWTAANFFFDMFIFFLFLFQHLAFWRIPLLWYNVYKEFSRYGCELCPCSLATGTTVESVKSEYRKIILVSFGIAIVDFLTLMLTLPTILLSVFSWRSLTYLHQAGYYTGLDADSYGIEWGFSLKARFYSWKIVFVTIPTDILTLFCFFLAHVPFWRVPPLYRWIGAHLKKKGCQIFPTTVETNNYWPKNPTAISINNGPSRSLSTNNNNNTSQQQQQEDSSCCSSRSVYCGIISQYRDHENDALDFELKFTIIIDGFLRSWFYLLIDFLCLPLYFFSLFSWRAGHFIHQASYYLNDYEVNELWLLSEETRATYLENFCWNVRITAVKIALFEIPLDLICGFLFLLSHIVFWRMPKMYVRLYQHLSRYGTCLFPKSTLTEHNKRNGNLIHMFPPTPNPTYVAGKQSFEKIREIPLNPITKEPVLYDEPCFTSINCDCSNVSRPTDATRIFICYDIFLRGWTQFVVDIFTAPPFIITLLSWRFLKLIDRIQMAIEADDDEEERAAADAAASQNQNNVASTNPTNADSSSTAVVAVPATAPAPAPSSSSTYNTVETFSWRARGVVWQEFFKLFLDVPCALLGFLGCFLAVWRVPHFISTLSEMYDFYGFPILPHSQRAMMEKEAEAKFPNFRTKEKKQRQAIIMFEEVDLQERYRVAICMHFISSAIELCVLVLGVLPTIPLALAPWRWLYLLRGFGFFVYSEDGKTTCNSQDDEELKSKPFLSATKPPATTTTTSNSPHAIPLVAPSADAASEENQTQAQQQQNTAPNATSGTLARFAVRPKVKKFTFSLVKNQQLKRKRHNERAYTSARMNERIDELSADEIDFSKYSNLWRTSLQAVLDVFGFVAFLVAHISLIRIPFLYKKIYKEFKRTGCELLPWTIPQQYIPYEEGTLTPEQEEKEFAEKENNHKPAEVFDEPLERVMIGRPQDPDSHFRKIFFSQAAHALMELALLPVIILLVLTYYRAVRIWDFTHRMEDEDEDDDELPHENATAKTSVVSSSSSPTTHAIIPATATNTDAAEQQLSPTTATKKETATARAQRKAALRAAWNGSLYKIPHPTPIDQKIFIISETLHLLVDVFFAALSLIVLCSGLRTITFINDIRDIVFKEGLDFEQRNLEWIALVLIHLLQLFFRDIPCLPFMLITLASLYRGFILISEIKRRVSRWADIRAPAIKVEKIFLAPPASGRKTGIELHVHGTKDPNFVLDSNESISLYIRGNDRFWDNVASAHGSLAAGMGQNLLPYVIKQQHFDAANQIKKGETNVKLVFDFDTAPKTSSFEKNLARLPTDTTAIIQVEYGSHTGTLFYASLKTMDCHDALVADASKKPRTRKPTTEHRILANYFSLSSVSKAKTTTTTKEQQQEENSAENQYLAPHEIDIDPSFSLEKYLETEDSVFVRWKGERFTDVWWLSSLIQTGLLILDIITVVAFLLLHLFPHRIIALYSQACESKERRRNRKFTSVVDEIIYDVVKPFPENVQNILDTCSGRLKIDPRYIDSYTASSLKSWITNCKYDFEQRFTGVLAERGADDMFAPQLREILDLHMQFAQEFHDAMDRQLSNRFSSSSSSSAVTNTTNTNTTAVSKRRNEHFIDDSDDDNKNAGGGRGDGAPNEGKGLPLLQVYEIDPRRSTQLLGKSKDLQSKSLKILEKIRPQIESTGSCCDLKSSDGIDGFRLDLGKMWIELIMDIPAVICFAFVLVTVYRFPWLCYKLWMHPRSPRKMCFMTISEMFTDVCYLILFAMSTIGIRSIFLVPYELVRGLWYYPSFRLARMIVLFYWVRIFHDVARILKGILTWEMLKFVLATGFFGFFSPGVLIQGAIVQNQGESDTCVAGLILVFGILWMFGLPAILAYTVYEKTNAYNPAASGIAYFVVFLVFYILCLIISFLRRAPELIQLRRVIVRTARPNWHNLSNFFWILIELVQLLALCFTPLALSGNVFSSGASDKINDATRAVYLLFLRPGSNTTTVNYVNDSNTMIPVYEHNVVPTKVPVGAAVSVAIVVVYFFMSTLPIVCGYVLKWEGGKEIRKTSGYGSIMKALGFGFQLLVARNIAEVLACENRQDGEMFIQPGLVCYNSPEHGPTAVALMIFGIYYFISTLCHNVIFDEADAARSDIITAEFYRHLTNGPTVIAVVCVALLQGQGTAPTTRARNSLIPILIAGVWGLVFSSGLYSKMINTQEKAFCTHRLVELLRIALYFSVTVCAILCLIVTVPATDGNDNTNFDDMKNLWVVWASLGVSLISFVVAYIWATYFFSKNPEEDSLDEIREDLLQLEEKFVEKDKVSAAWLQMRKAWRARVESAVRVSTLAAAAVHFEQAGLSAMNLNVAYLNTRTRWQNDALKLIDDSDRHGDLQNAKMIWKLRQIAGETNDDSDDDSNYGFSHSSHNVDCGCCRCCCYCCRYNTRCSALDCCYYGCYACCEHDRGGLLIDGNDSDVDSNEDMKIGQSKEHVNLLGRVVQSLKNGVDMMDANNSNQDNNNNHTTTPDDMTDIRRKMEAIKQQREVENAIRRRQQEEEEEKSKKNNNNNNNRNSNSKPAAAPAIVTQDLSYQWSWEVKNNQQQSQPDYDPSSSNPLTPPKKIGGGGAADEEKEANADDEPIRQHLEKCLLALYRSPHNKDKINNHEREVFEMSKGFVKEADSGYPDLMAILRIKGFDDAALKFFEKEYYQENEGFSRLRTFSL